MRFLGILDKNTCREVGYAYRCYPLGLERHFSVLFWKIMSIGRYSAGYSIFGRISVKTHNSKKSKIMKIHHFLKSHPECLWGQELVSRPSLTPNLPIFKRKNSSQKELIPYIISEILTFFDFYEIHVGCKSFHLWVNCRNFYPKISSLKSLEKIDVFCTINRNFLIITTKLT